MEIGVKDGVGVIMGGGMVKVWCWGKGRGLW